MKQLDRKLTTGQAARIAEVSAQAIRDWIDKGWLRAERAWGGWQIRERDLERCLKERDEGRIGYKKRSQG